MAVTSSSYLILHSYHGGDLSQPWHVIRCYHANDDQDRLFTGSRQAAAAYLADHWDDPEPADSIEALGGMLA